MIADDAGFVLTSRRYGVVMVDDVDDLLAAAALARGPGRHAGRRVAVVTTSGGAGGLAADRLEDQGLVLPELGAPTQELLAPLIPAFGSLANPVDVTAQLFNQGAHAFADVCRIVADDPDVDAVAVLLTMVVGEPAAALADDLVKTAAELDKPLLVAWLAGHDLTVEGRRVFRDAGMPVFSSVAAVARVLGRLATAAEAAGVPDVPAEPAYAGAVRAVVGSGAPVDELGPALLDAVGIARPRSVLATTADEAAIAAAGLGPTAMKLHAPGLAHKSDVGGVAVGVEPAEAAATFSRLMASATDHGITATGVELQQMVAPGVELLVGVIAGRDGFAPIVTVGMGGVTTELYRDVASASAPLGGDEALGLLRTLRAWPLLEGFRGSPPVDIEAVVDAVVAAGWAAVVAADRVAEIEINPLIAGTAGATAVDVLVRAHADTTERACC